MKNKIIKPVLLLAACFVMQMTGAMGMDATAQAKQKPPAPAAKGAQLPLDQQIQKIEADLLAIRGQITQHLQGKLPGKVNGIESAEALRSLIAAKSASLDVAKAGATRTWRPIISNLPGYDEFYANQQALEKEIRILAKELPTIDKHERDRKVKTLEAELGQLQKAARKAEEDRLERDRQEADLRRQADERRRQEEADRQEEEDRLEREHQEALEVARQAAEARAREELVLKTKKVTIVQAAVREHLARKKVKQEDDLVTNFLGYLGEPTTVLRDKSREARLVSWATGSYNVFNQTHPDYTFVKARANADQYGILFDLAVSYRFHNPLDGHADNSWILIARDKIDPDSNLSAAVKLVRQCSAVLDGKDIDDEVSKGIDAMMADTLATGGRIGIDLHRQATDAEMLVMIRALRISGQRALALAGDDAGNALEEIAKTYLDAPFKSQKGDTSSRVVGYPDDKLFNSHKAHCFIAATRGLGDIDDQLEAKFSVRLGQMGVSNVKATRAGYDTFDKE